VYKKAKKRLKRAMAYHSIYNREGEKNAYGICIAPIRTNVSGPAPKPKSDKEDDIIDETIKSFRLNIFFKNYEIKGKKG